MERVWQWVWDRHGPRFSWGLYAISVVILVPIFVLSATIIVAFEGSGGYLVGIGAAVLAVIAALYAGALPGSARWRLVERWAAGDPVDPYEALEATYAIGRGTVLRGLLAYGVTGAVMPIVILAGTGASAGRVLEWMLSGTLQLVAVYLIAAHSYVEAALRPARAALVADSEIGDALPRSRPTFAAWSNMTILATAWVFTLAGAALSAVIDGSDEHPALAVGIATGMGLFFAVPITMGAAFAPSLQPIRDLAAATRRVAAGDYSQRLPVVQDDDLGALAADFNRMQAGLAERERLRAAFGSYVDPALATRLLGQGDDIFTGERREVTVMFVDIRDFTPFAEASTAEDTVAHLNALFEIVVPAVVEAGGHVNKYLGDGAMAVFGAPNQLARHADAAVGAALRIHQLVAEHFEGTLRIGTGINTGQVIAGTIGGGGKLEFTLIGDAVNVAARVEQLTKETGDAILMTDATRAALSSPRPRSTKRGAFELKGKSAAVTVHAIEPPGRR